MDSTRSKQIEIVRNWIREQNRGFYPIGLEPDAWLVSKQATMLVDKLEECEIEQAERRHEAALDIQYSEKHHE